MLFFSLEIFLIFIVFLIFLMFVLSVLRFVIIVFNLLDFLICNLDVLWIIVVFFVRELSIIRIGFKLGICLILIEIFFNLDGLIK